MYGDILGVILKINHTLLEPWLPAIWIICPVMSLSAIQSDFNISCKNPDVLLVDVCVDMYVRLRQVSKSLSI